MKKILFVCGGLIFFCALVSWAFEGAAPEDQELFFLELADIATGHPQPKFEAPSTVTVITAEEIHNLGARTLLDALRLVPGLDVGLDVTGVPIVSMRGLYTPGSEKILFMLNGRPVNNPLTGGGTLFFADLSVDKVERVEVIRGPGSVLYGANAFCGVINIVLKRENPEAVSYRRGSYDTDEIGLQFDHFLGKAFSWFNLSYRDTSGANLKYEQTLFDRWPSLFESQNNLHYDKSNEWVRRGEYYGGIEWGPFLLESFYIHHADGGYYNLSGVPSDKTRFARENFYLHLSYDDKIAVVRSKIDLDLNYYHHHQFVDYFPPGTIFIHPHQDRKYFFPEGLSWLRELEIFSFGLESRFSMVKNNHRFTWGAVIHNDDLHNPRLQENLRSAIVYDPWHTCSKQGPLYTSDCLKHNWISPEDRFYYALYFQDEWQLTPDASLVVGVRNDYYEEFGSNLNFRAAFILHPYKNWYFKLLYGEAFRVPSFQELYVRSCPTNHLQGNLSLDTEDMESYELAIDYLSKQIELSLVFFYHNYYDLIYVGDSEQFGIKEFKNSSSTITSTGIEVEGKVRWGPGNLNYLLFNYAYQDTNVPENLFLVPPYHLFSFVLNYYIFPRFSLNYHFSYVGKRFNSSVDDYCLSDLVFNFFSVKYNVSAGVYNLFDKHYFLPSFNTVQYPEGYKRPGRTFGVKLTWFFQ